MRVAPALGVVLFWIGTLVAGAASPGYSAGADYVSSLAGRGAEAAGVGIGALVALATAHLAAAAVVRGPAGIALLTAGGCGLVVAAFRTGCPLGAAGCGTAPNDTPGDVADALHVVGVIGYEIALVVAMVVWALRSRGAARVLTAGAAVASVLLAVRIGGPDLGLDQRLWLAVNTGWLAAATLATAPRPREMTPSANRP